MKVMNKMIQKNHTKKSFILIVVIILIVGFYQPPLKIQGQQSGLQITTVSWQDQVIPGTTDAGLSVEFINLNNVTIKGIIGNLSVNYPFSDSFDSDQTVIETGVATSTYINVSQYSILPGEPFQILFSLNIDINATKGVYSSFLNVSYLLLNLTNRFQEFNINLVIPNRPPILEWSRPEQGSLVVEENETIFFEAIGYDPDNDTLFYEWKLDGITVSDDDIFVFNIDKSAPTIYHVTLIITDGLEDASREWLINVENSPITEFSINSQYLEAGSTTNLEIKISNNIWNNTVECSLAVPQPIVIRGNSTQTYEEIDSKDSITFSVTLFTPSSSIGQTAIATLTITYTDKYTTLIEEEIPIGLIVKGRLVVNLIDVMISDNIVDRGSSLTISGTILNTGNIPALFTNLSVISSIFDETSTKFIYLGELEPDSPLPFSLTVKIATDATLGLNLVQGSIHYQSDIFEEFSINFSFDINVLDVLSSSNETSSLPNLIVLIIQSGFPLIIILGTVSSISIVLYRYYRKK